MIKKQTALDRATGRYTDKQSSYECEHCPVHTHNGFFDGAKWAVRRIKRHLLKEPGQTSVDREFFEDLIEEALK